ncbi:hypothetical protein CUT44_18860 [Streptomyces carminius]|uniref:Uncharacterized protein n=1 Tax=Streptomyces carminius TaxID=2665496 RepID=A0A2M8LX59_9ACTN|nr:hypothetical protein [Streptomyces carminius]PJE96543.1 hypothetical protein CUT44_18860 [Streptomyces carminius]
MSGDGGDADLDIDGDHLDRITRGLRDAIGELKDIGPATGALLGAGFENLSMTGMETGHGRLAREFETFCEDWEWGVRALVQDASDLAARMGLAAGLLWEEEQYLGGTFKVGANALLGNPHLSEEEVTRQSWRELVTPDAPEMGPDALRRAADEAGQTWRDTARGAATEGTGGRLTDWALDEAGADERTRDRMLDEAFGPSPEDGAGGGR